MAMAFGRKIGETNLTEAMKDKFKLYKKPRGYAITSIFDLAVKVVMQILVGNVMRRCHVDEVSAPVIALAA